MYDNSAPAPDLSARLIKHILYPLWAAKNGSARLRYLDELERSQYWSREVLIDQQWTLFRAMVTHAFETCPYYRRKFRQVGLEPADLRSREHINSVPTITKEEIQEHRTELISTRYPVGSLIPDMTGGSTGSPMQFYYDRDRQDSRVAAMLRHNRWAGWDIGDRAAILWGAPQDTRRSGKLRDSVRTWIQERRLILDASALDDAAMARFARALARYQPKVLLAYANTLGLFARYVQAENIEGIRPRGIICSAEVLTEENRRLIEKAFACPVFNRYGSREFAMIASECEKHEGMHINAENLLIEALSEGRSCTDADGELVITDLRNFAMPLIRYRIRDVGRLKQAACSCPRGLPLMDVSGGRVTDFLHATNGSKVSGVVIATYVITNIPGIKQIQFIQHDPGAVTIKLVKGHGWSAEAMNELTERAHKYLGSDMRLQLEFRDQIPQEKSGKYRFSISTLA